MSRIGKDLLTAGLLKRVSLKSKGLVSGGDSGVADEHMGLKDRKLSGLLLFLSLVVKTQHSLVHDPCEHGHLFNLLLFWHSPQFILKRNSDFGFKEAFLLLGGHGTHITNVPKPIKFVKF